jgi:hypothetical protein
MAFAAKLDKAACAELSTELSALTGTGIKAEMDRGPEWAKANMPPERLQSARRLLELEDQLEFRCGVRSKRKPAEQTATRTPGAGTPPPPNVAQDSTTPAEQPAPRSAPAMLAPAIKPPVALKPANVVPAPPTQRTSTAPPVAGPGAAAPATPAAAAPPAAAKPQQPVPITPTTPPEQTAATAPIEDNAPAEAASIGPTPSGPVTEVKKPDDPVVVKKKNSRRNPASAYVAPSEVNPFSLPGMR